MKAVGVFLLLIVMMGISLEDESEMDEDELEFFYGGHDSGESATTVSEIPKIRKTTPSAQGSG